MSTEIDHFRVEGLHGYRDIELEFQDNTLVLIGENGSGKTTLLRILFYFLSGRWLALSQIRFNRIQATLGGREYSISHEQILTAIKTDRRFLRNLPGSMRQHILNMVRNGRTDQVVAEVESLAASYGISASRILAELEGVRGDPNEGGADIQEVAAQIATAVNAQVLYLPTYRRIERELSSIFEGEGIESARKREVIRQPETNASYIELVEFGMKDVKAAIDRALVSNKEFARVTLNNLTLRHLGDVVKQEYKYVSNDDIAEITDDTVQAVLSRIDESILPFSDKQRLYELITSTRSAPSLSEHEKIVYHYFSKLLEFQDALKAKERPITTFCDVVSAYIKDKSFEYDSRNFSFSMRHRLIRSSTEDKDTEIKLGDLSSGEKQIVSLFSHLYLSGTKRFFVLIDEPELSLSVSWQRNLLPDIRRSELCAGLLAVTHSPFIYDNELRSYARSMGEFY